MKSRQKISIGLAMVAVVGIAMFTQISTSGLRDRAPAASDQRALVSDAVKEAIMLDMASLDPNPPATLTLTKRPTIQSVRAASANRIASKSSVNDALIPSQIRLRLSSRQVAVGRVFTGNAAQKQVAETQSTIDSEADPTFQNFGGGVESIDISNITLKGSHADATAVAVGWAAMASRNPDGKWIAANPTNKLNISVGLDQDSQGVWKVSSYDWSFVNGFGP